MVLLLFGLGLRSHVESRSGEIQHAEKAAVKAEKKAASAHAIANNKAVEITRYIKGERGPPGRCHVATIRTLEGKVKVCVPVKE